MPLHSNTLSWYRDIMFLFFYSNVISGDATNTNLIAFCLTLPGIECRILCIGIGHDNHYYNIDALGIEQQKMATMGTSLVHTEDVLLN